jgi:hypothetical protein
MDVAAADAQRSASARDRAERRVAELEQARLGGSVGGREAAAVPGAPAATPGRSRRRGELPGGPLAMLALAAVAVAVAFAGGLLTGGGDDRDPVAASVAPAKKAASPGFAPPLVPCDAIVPGTEDRLNVVCGLRGRILHLGAGRRPLGLPDVTARVLDVRSTLSSVVVRLRLGNRTARAQTVEAEPRNVYLAVGGGRVFGRTRAPARIAPRGSGRFTLIFNVDPARLAAATTDGADLGIVGFGIDPGQRDRAQHVGAIRLELTAPDAAAGR